MATTPGRPASTEERERPAPAAGPGADATAAGAVPAPEEEPEEEHGRIGYGRYGRFTPLALAVLLVAGLAAIGLAQRGPDAAPPAPAAIAGKPAPDVTLTLLDGSRLRLADLRGSVVVLNFWASFCAPCRDEMPLLQAYAERAATTGERTAIVGVGVRTDVDADARALVRELGVTYPIGRDTATEAPGEGPIQRAFGPVSFLPTTVFVRPDGVVNGVHIGELDAEGLRDAVAAARMAEDR